MRADAAFTVNRWTGADRLDEILAMIHAAFASLQPSSGALNETVADLERRQRLGMVLVARAGNGVIGSVFCAADGDALYLTRLAVAPAWRRRGVGGALLAEAEAEARRLGARRLTLRVRVTLPENRAYFERFGFAVTGSGQEPGRTPYVTMEHVLRPAP